MGKSDLDRDDRKLVAELRIAGGGAASHRTRVQVNVGILGTSKYFAQTLALLICPCHTGRPGLVREDFRCPLPE